MRRYARILFLLTVFLILVACAAPRKDRINPQYQEQLSSTKSITVVPLSTDVYQVTAGGVVEKMDEWSAQARRNVMTAVEGELTTKPMILIKPFEESLLTQDQRFNLEQTKALFDAVNSSIIFHTYGPPVHRFQDKYENLGYSLGAEVQQLVQDTDTLLVVSCSDQISTAGRKALFVAAALLGAVPNYGATIICIALVDARSGEILWYNFHGSRGDQDLRDPIKTTTVVKKLFNDFPIK